MFPPEFKVGPADRRLRVLFVYSRPPIPMKRADQMTVAHLLQFFGQRGHEVDLITLDDAETVTEECRNWLRRTVRSHTVIRQTRSLRGANAVLRGFQGIPLQIGLFHNRSLQKAVADRLEAEQYDLGYCYYVRTAYALAKSSLAEGRKPPITFLALQLSQALNTQRIAHTANRLRDRLVYGVESRLMSRYEARITDEYDRIGLISSHDVSSVSQCRQRAGLPPLSNWILTPHGVDVERFHPSPEADVPTLVFSGSMSTNTNVEAIKWFIQGCWSTLKSKNPALELLVVGRNPTREVVTLGALPGVRVVGEVKDPALFIGRSTVCINPMQAGAGMQNKLIEYLACGKSVVATSLANEGISAIDGEHLLIADNANTFTQAVQRLLERPALRRELGQRARSFILDYWTWEYHFLQQEAAIVKEIGLQSTSTFDNR